MNVARFHAAGANKEPSERTGRVGPTGTHTYCMYLRFSRGWIIGAQILDDSLGIVLV